MANPIELIKSFPRKVNEWSMCVDIYSRYLYRDSLAFRGLIERHIGGIF